MNDNFETRKREDINFYNFKANQSSANVTFIGKQMAKVMYQTD